MTAAVLCVAVIPATPALAGTGTAGKTGAPAGAAADLGAQTVREPAICEPRATKWTWTAKKKPWTVTHAKAFENFSGATITRTKSVSRETTITASATVAVGTKFKANAIIAKLDTTVDFTLALSGSHTNKSSESVTGKMKSGHTYIYYAGARKVSGNYTYTVCNSRGTQIIQKSRGSAKSFGVKTEGAVQCGTNPPKSTLAYKVERAYC